MEVAETMKVEANYTLVEASQRLQVHYMTAYRYVRTGRLVAHQEGVQWLVADSELDRFERAKNEVRPVNRSATMSIDAEFVKRLVARLIAGDENGCWQIAQEALAGGATPSKVYLSLFAPAMRLIGEQWATGRTGVADEHRATVVMHRLVGRMGPLFRTRGRRIGTVVLGAPAGDMHDLPVTMTADILRCEGFDVVDLGGDVPSDAFTDCVLNTNNLVAIAVCVTWSGSRRDARQLVSSFKQAAISVPVLIGGAGVCEADVLAIGADYWAMDVPNLVALIRSL